MEPEPKYGVEIPADEIGDPVVVNDYVLLELERQRWLVEQDHEQDGG